MKLALEKYGINMPLFGKIGGILANEVGGGEGELCCDIVGIHCCCVR